MSEKIVSSNRRIIQVTNIGVAGNVFLSVLKIIVGYTAGSMALVADGFHSVSDLATDLAVILGVYFGSKAPDPEHPYGHGRLETFSTAFVAVVLVFVGGVTIRNAAIEVATIPYSEHKPIAMAVLWTAAASVVIKEAMFRLNRGVAKKYHSSALYANAWHHRSDAISSVAVIIGFVAVKMGYSYGDQVAAIAVGLLIIIAGVRIIGGCLQEFSEKSVDGMTVEKIRHIIEEHEDVRSYHRLRTRTLGREVFMDLHILVDPELSITEAHKISSSLEGSIDKHMQRPVNVMVHVEPYLPEMLEEKD